MDILFRILLTFNATSLLIIVYLVQNSVVLLRPFNVGGTTICVSPWISYIGYITIPLVLTLLSIALSRFLGRDEFRSGAIGSIEYANNSFLPSYLGYFFVALSITGFNSLIFVYALLFIFTFLSQALYFNPLFLVFGYKFYNVKTKKGVTIFLISKNDFKVPDEIVIGKACRINNYTYLER